MDTETTLEQVLVAAGYPPEDPRLAWMVLTWDLAKFHPDGRDHFQRIFLTTTAVAGDCGPRGPRHFLASASTLGQPTAVPNPPEVTSLNRFSFNNPWGWAMSQTEGLLQDGGYRMVCRPLAVDCSALAGQRFPDGTTVEGPEQLLHGLNPWNKAGQALLHQINRTRDASMGTHLAEGWEDLFPALDVRRLWSGRPARARNLAALGGSR